MRASSPTPTRVGTYELIRLIGEGSMGRVYQARHTKLDRTVAIKILRAEQARDPDLVQRFFQEARTVNRINHPHIVQIHDFVEETDEAGRPQAYCVMEYVAGHTLAELMRQECLTLDRVLRIADQVCRALQAAHEVGVVHRDIKPENVLVTRGGDGQDVAKVLDFGVAKLLTPDPALSLDRTFEGAIVGTPKYMAPEQAASLDVDFRTDVYGVGCLVYEMLAGRPAFDGERFAPLVAQILTQPPSPLEPRSCAGDVLPAALQSLVLQCLEKDPSLRPQTLADVRTRLQEAATAAPRAKKWRPAAALVPFAAAVALLMVFGLDASSANGHVLPENTQLAHVDPDRRAGDGERRRNAVERPVTSPERASPNGVAAQEAATSAAGAAGIHAAPKAAGRAKVPGASGRKSRDDVLNPFAK